MKNNIVFRSVKTAFRLEKTQFILMFILGLVNGLCCVAAIYFVNSFFSLVEKCIVQNSIDKSTYGALGAYFVLSVMTVLYSVYYKKYYVQFKSIPSFEKKMRATLHKKCNNISNEQFNIPNVDLHLRQARTASVNVYRLTEIVVTICTVGISTLSIGGYLSSFSPWFIIFIVIAVFPPLIGLLYKAKMWKKFYRQMGELKREEECYSEAICGIVSSKENKVNGADKILLCDWLNARNSADILENSQSNKVFVLQLMLCVLNVIGNYGGFALSAVLFWQGIIGLGEFSAAIVAYMAIKNLAVEIFELCGELKKYGTMVAPYFQFMDLPERRPVIPQQYSGADGILLDNVSFKYPNANMPAIDHISLEICRGDHLAIVGENGAGKTTLLNVILGLYKAGGGKVLYNGTDVENFMEEELYSDKAIVQQNFNAYLGMNLIENITLGSAIEKSKIIDITKKTGIDYLDRQMLLGKEYGGVELSGGEWQRIACARAFVRPFEIVGLDEPTGAIDPLCEKEMYDFFQNYTKNKTAIVVTHRLGAIRICNKIVVMRNGKIVAVGEHNDLLKTCAYYKELWEAQANTYEYNNG